jgi:hypothetical protein
VVGRYEILKAQFPEIVEEFFDDTQEPNTRERGQQHTEYTGLMGGNDRRRRIRDLNGHGSCNASVDE